MSNPPASLTAILLALAISAAPLAASAGETAAPQNRNLAPSIIAVKAETAHIVDRVLVNGLISPVEEILVQPQVEGLAVDELLADVGDRVKAGQALARLSKDQLLLQKSQLEANRAKAEAGLAQFQAQRVEVEANMRELEKAADRAKTLAERGTYSSVQAEQAAAQATGGRAQLRSVEESLHVGRAEIAVVEAQIKDVDLRLARTEVRARADGVITARGAKVGAIASASSEALFTMIRDGKLELKADVSETDLLKIEPGQAVDISVSGLAQTIAGKVRLIEPTLSANTRLGTVRIEIADTFILKSGLFAEAQIVVAERDGVVVPVTSVNLTRTSAVVLKISDDRAAMTPITTGIRDGGRIEVVAGLEDGDLIVAKAGAFVRDGDRINPVLQDENRTTTAAVTD